MTQPDFEAAIAANGMLDRIRALAEKTHRDVNQTYDETHPYIFHLDMVADFTRKFGWEICQSAEDALPIMFGAYFHDSIEDARLTYNDLMALARTIFDPDKATMATEIAYALTNEKGRNRAERANDKYYAGIRATPYAPLVKLADRLANVSYSVKTAEQGKPAKLSVYASENPHFLESITVAEPSDPRLMLPDSMVMDLRSLLP